MMNFKGINVYKNVGVFFIKTLLFSFLFFACSLILLSAELARREVLTKDNIYPGVYVSGKDFGGKTKGEVETYFDAETKKLTQTQIFLRYKDEEATFSAQTISLQLDSKTAAEQAYLVGRGDNMLSATHQKIVTLFGLGAFHFTAPLNYDDAPFKEYLSELEERYNTPAQNALFQFQDGRVTAFRIEKDGQEILTENTLQSVKEQLHQISKTKNNKVFVRVEEKILEPEVTLANINDLGIEEKIAEGQSDYSGSIPGRIHNLSLAATKFNGVIVPKGATLSFNETVGDISAQTGYQQAYIIKNGQTVLGDGGGVCQVSTTLFRAALNAGLPIISRTAHAYRVHYYENDKKPGFDATVFAPTVDFKFTNDTETPILLQTEIDKNKRILKFILYGKRDGRVVEISDARLWDVRPAPEPRYQDDPTLPRGTTKQVDWAAPGTKSTFHYKVVKEGAILQDRDFYSNFRPWQAVFLVGTGG